jgi:Fic family protein
VAADWDADSAQLRKNLTVLLEHLADNAEARRPLTAASIKRWHSAVMKGLKVPNAEWTGRFRGEAGLARMRVVVGSYEGAPAAEVAAAVRAFVGRLARALARLDRVYPVGADLTSDGLAAAVEVTAWAHAQWIRIHPFANGNGRTARIIANVILMRYGLPPVLRLRPRPDGDYAEAADAAMRGDHDPTALLILSALRSQTASQG